VTALPTPRAPEERHYALLGPGRVGELPRPVAPLPPDWARVEIAYCGLCGSDLSRYAGQRAADYPVSLGHEWVAVVREVAQDVRGIVPGDVVTTDLNHRCGDCRQCRIGRSHLCRQGQVGWFSNRGFARLVDIHAGYLQRCRHPPAPHLALAEPVSCALHAVAHCRLTPGERPLMIGAGGFGLCTAFVLCSTGQVAGFDVTERDPARLARLARAVDPVGRAVDTPTGCYEVVLDASGSPDGLRQACERVAPGGRLCTVSHLPDGVDTGFLLDLLLHKDATVTISYLNGPRENLVESVRLLEQSWAPRWDALLDVRPLHQLPEVFAARATSPANKVVIEVAGSGLADRPQPGLEVVGADPLDVR
jgi:threonine dehydrogenase-like Zn-dependent dehydrogenase